MPIFRFDNTYVRDLPGTWAAWQPAAVPDPRLLFLNRDLASDLGLDADALAGSQGTAILAGNQVPDGAEPIAQAYAGHQFGGFSPQLGDGRALLLGEVIDPQGWRRDIALKGSGRTPFSRGGDGKAAVGPMLREVLIGESMHALGVPTTRALAVVATGEAVRRERALPGAVLTRVAASHLRVGTLQYFAARGDIDTLRRVVDYAIARHDPQIAAAADGAADHAVNLLIAVARRQARLLAAWMNVGFIHGVMNTDNMTLSGETIDYGPCAFMEAYDPKAVFSSIDEGGRYAYGNQPGIARWNLARLAEALLPLIVSGDDEAAREAAIDRVRAVIDAFPAWYEAELLAGQRRKLGLPADQAEADAAGRRFADAQPLIDAWLALLQAQAVDFTQAWRALGDAAAGDDAPLQALFAEPAAVAAWLSQWRTLAGLPTTGDAERAMALRAVNPRIIARNHRVEEALEAATDHNDLTPFNDLLAALRRPFDDDPALARYAEPAPAAVTAHYQTFCGT